MSNDMDLAAACHAVLGDEAANAIINGVGLGWAVVAAIAAATTDHDPRAIAALDKWQAALRQPEDKS